MKRCIVLLFLVSTAAAAASAGLKTGDRKALALPGGAKMVLIYCAPGEFMMGSDNGERDERPVHRVRLTHGFWMGKCEVTQRQWKSVMGGNPSDRKGDYLPVTNLRLGEIMEFIGKIEAHCHGVRAWLPTEAQWEYACRAGTTGDYAGEIDRMGWHSGNSDNSPHLVGNLRPNPWGFHDMHGNVWEVCNDVYGSDYYAKSPTNDPPGAMHILPRSRMLRNEQADTYQWNDAFRFVSRPGGHVIRGGCWYLGARDCRSARRQAVSFGYVKDQLIGFRICCVLP